MTGRPEATSGPIGDGGREDEDPLRDWLARELHDGVANELQTLLIEMELLRRGGLAADELQEWQATVREVLLGLRRLLLELRGRSSGEVDAIRAGIEGKLVRGAILGGRR